MFSALSLVVLAHHTAAAPAPWPQWRGPNRDGHILATAQAWPNKIGPQQLREVWRVDNLGPSYSGPIVIADRVFTTETVDAKTEVVRAFDRMTGKELWKQSWLGSMTVPFFAARNGSWIRSTPAYANGRLYVAGMRDYLVCLDADNGKVVWTVDFVQQFGTPLPTFGFVCSPLVDGDAVYVQAGGGFAKLDTATGKVLWRTLVDGGGMMGSAFSSPVIATVGDVRQAVVQTRMKLAGVNLDTGAVLWSRDIPSFRGMNILTPIPFKDGIFTSTYGGRSQWIQVIPSKGNWETADRWSVRYEGNMTSPVVIDGHAYLLGKDRRFVCFDLAAGKMAWQTEQTFGQYWSLVANRDKLLGLDERGKLYLVKANPAEFELLDERKVSNAETWAHLAATDDGLVIRDLGSLIAYKWAGLQEDTP